MVTQYRINPKRDPLVPNDFVNSKYYNSKGNPFVTWNNSPKTLHPEFVIPGLR